MEPWKQPITAPRQPDFGADQALEDELRGHRQHRPAEDPPPSRPIEVGRKHPSARELFGVGAVTILATAIVAAILFAIFGW